MFRKKLYYVHRLIAQTFIKNENNFPLVDHIDRNKRNNHVENLRWATSKMNIDNQEKVDNALKRDGVRKCDNPKEYYKAYRIYKRRGKKMKNELNWNKHKRCLAMARWCEERYNYLTCLENWQMTDKEYQQVIGDYWDRWHKRWLKIAEQFKEGV